MRFEQEVKKCFASPLTYPPLRPAHVVDLARAVKIGTPLTISGTGEELKRECDADHRQAANFHDQSALVGMAHVIFWQFHFGGTPMRKSHFLSKEAATGSLVALVASTLATGALANIPRVSSGRPGSGPLCSRRFGRGHNGQQWAARPSRRRRSGDEGRAVAQPLTRGSNSDRPQARWRAGS